MTNTIVCYKWVKSEEDIRVLPDSGIDLSRAKKKISDYDRNAIETARVAADLLGGKALGLTFGSDDAKASLKDALARGLAEAFWVHDRLAETADGFVTANVLAAAIRKIGDWGLVVCAEGAADTYSHQVGPRIAELLDIPVLSCVANISIEGNQVTATRRLDSHVETVRAALPALITTMPEINPAPIPGLKAVLNASKKPISEFALAELGLEPMQLTPQREIVSLSGFAMQRKCEVFKTGSAAERIDELVRAIRKEGVI
jgi:electron transfer flavoprotein beta subunit